MGIKPKFSKRGGEATRVCRFLWCQAIAHWTLSVPVHRSWRNMWKGSSCCSMMLNNRIFFGCSKHWILARTGTLPSLYTASNFPIFVYRTCRYNYPEKELDSRLYTAGNVVLYY